MQEAILHITNTLTGSVADRKQENNRKTMYKRIFLIALLALATCGGRLQAQSFDLWTPYDTTVATQCGDYLYPKEFDPCPCLKIKQKDSLRHEHGDHTTQQRYADRGWDTALTRNQREIEITCTPYLVVQKFNGQYTVDRIGWHPDDPSFHWGTLLDNDDDDSFCGWQPLQTDFPFYFFGKKKTGFVAGGNGIITFNQAASNQSCAYCNPMGLPWGSSTNNNNNWCITNNSGGTYGTPVSYYRDAIYGIFQDTDLRTGVNTAQGQGIWYGVRPKTKAKPCRRIIASYNELPFFSNETGNRQKYQIVCYEGTNVIEIYVARRAPASSSWCKNGVIGIQNATGEGQVRGSDPLGPEGLIEDGAWPAYYPREYKQSGTRRAGNVEMDQIGTDANHPPLAWRFTPHGHTETEEGWYRINPDGTNDTLPVNMQVGENQCYAFDMAGKNDQDEYTDACPNLNRAIIRGLTEPTKFVFYMNFKNANNDWYYLTDTIFVGVDYDSTLYLHGCTDPKEDTVYEVCQSTIGDIHFDFSALNDTVSTSWRILRRSNGQDIELPVDDVLTLGNLSVIDSIDTKRIPVQLKEHLPETGWRENKVDSLRLELQVRFNNGSRNWAVCWVYIYPEFNIDTNIYLCEGEDYYWDATHHTYLQELDTIVHLTAGPDCDSTVHLKLIFTSYYTETIHKADCVPYTWERNGVTYDHSVVTTLHVDNEYGCDSILTLDFQYIPLKAVIHSDLDHFDYDHTEVELQDLSEGADETQRRWVMPDQSERNGTHVYYSIPREEDSATFYLFEKSLVGNCNDSDTLTLRYNKEALYVPSAFTPGSAVDNYLFRSYSQNTLTEEMYIYNRRGELVYQCAEVDCTWDGRDLNGTPCPQGAYIYLIRYTDRYEPDRVHVLHGTVTLIR